MITHTGDLDVAALQRALAPEGYGLSLAATIEKAFRRRNTSRDYLEIGAVFVVLAAIALALQRFHLLPRGLSVSDQMSYGLVFVIGLVASVSSCLAVTGGLLVALAAKYNEANPDLTDRQRLTPHVYFNAGRLISYTLLGGAIGALGSALTLSPAASGALTLLASLIMVLLGLNMLGLFPSICGLLAPSAEVAVSQAARCRRARNQRHRLRAGCCDLLPSLRLHAGAAALCAEPGQLRRRRADHAGLCPGHAAGAALALRDLEPRPGRLPEALPALCGRRRDPARRHEHPLRAGAHRQAT